MQIIFKLFIIIGIFSSGASHAQDLKLLGPGVVDRQTGDSIAVACTDDSCKEYRFVYYSAESKKTEMVGEPMIAPTADNEKILQNAQRLTIENYLDYHSRNLGNKLERQAKITFFLCAAGITVMALALPESPTTWAAAAAFGVTVTYIMMSHKVLSAFIGNGIVYKNAANQDGWKWSINAEKMKHKHFASLSRQIRSGARPFDSDSFELYDRYEKQRNKLRKKGASFVLQKYE